MDNSNPWLEIPAEIYEHHMSDKNILQIQKLNDIIKSQIEDYKPKYLAIFGVTTGNGLEYTVNVKNVYAIDINDKYLNICKERFNHNKNISFLKLDVQKDNYNFGKIDLAICNLIFEYVNEDTMAKKIAGILLENGVLSLVYQVNQGVAYISKSKYSDVFTILDKIHHNVNEEFITNIMKNNGLIKIKKEEFILPDNKKLIRIDFKKTA